MQRAEQQVGPSVSAGGNRASPRPALGKEAQPARRVLIVEDELLIALDLQHQLTAAGFEVVGMAASAEKAVSVAERERPEAVLMDIRLEGRATALMLPSSSGSGSRSALSLYRGTSMTR